MPQIILDLTDEAVTAYAEARGIGDNDMSPEEFLQVCVIADITELITSQMILDAQTEAASNVVVPDITSS